MTDSCKEIYVTLINNILDWFWDSTPTAIDPSQPRQLSLEDFIGQLKALKDPQYHNYYLQNNSYYDDVRITLVGARYETTQEFEKRTQKQRTKDISHLEKDKQKLVKLKEKLKELGESVQQQQDKLA